MPQEMRGTHRHLGLSSPELLLPNGETSYGEGRWRIGDLGAIVGAMFSRGQLRGLLQRLIEDQVVAVTGKPKGTRYALVPAFADLRGDALVNEALTHLRTLHDPPSATPAS